MDTVRKTDAEWQAQLTPEQYYVTRQAGTERPFSGPFYRHTERGRYRCVCCGALLFASSSKFDAGCGWPSFYEPVSEEAIRYLNDYSHGMQRTEIRCGNCDAHLGHVFPDGPQPTGERFCVNSASLSFTNDENGEQIKG